MIEVTGIAQQRAWARGVMPPVEQVRPGLWSIPVPIPDNPLRYVLLYALELRNGVAVVDAGWNTDEAWEALTSGLGVAGFSVTDVRSVLVTHIHPDHYGLAGRLREASGAWVALHPADAALLPARYGPQLDTLLARMRALLVDCGVPAEVLGELHEASMGIRQFVEFAEPDRLLEDGDRPELPGWDLRAVWTPGHSPGHICFYDAGRRLLLAGDHLLPRISPNVALHTQQRPNPLADFMDSLLKIRALAVDEVLPAHEYRFRRLDARVDALLAHHEARLEEIEGLLRRTPGLTCWELTTRLSWSRPWEAIQGFMRRAAVGETLAHLVVLEQRGRSVRRGADPARWFAAADAIRTLVPAAGRDGR